MRKKKEKRTDGEARLHVLVPFLRSVHKAGRPLERVSPEIFSRKFPIYRILSSVSCFVGVVRGRVVYFICRFISDFKLRSYNKSLLV